MTEQHDGLDTRPSSRVDAHKLSEFVYGTVTGMVAIAGIGGGADVSWLEAASIIVAGAVAIWIAHAFSILLTRPIETGRRIEARDMGTTLAGSWPIVIAGAILAAPLAGLGMGFWTLQFALRASIAVGLLMLAIVGALAGAMTKATWSRRFLLAIFAASLGLAVAAIEFAVHR